MLVRIGAILAVFAVVGIINLARSKPAGDVRYFNALADLTEQIHNNPFSNLDSIRRGINNLPIGGVTDPMLKEMHRMWLELLELADHADGSPEFEARARSLGQRIDNQIDKLNAKYGR